MTRSAPSDVSRPTRIDEFRNAWRPLLASAVGLACGLSPIAPYASGILANAMHRELGWAQSDILLTLLIAPVMLVFLGRHVGRLIDRVGPRRVAILSTLGLGLAELLVAAIGSSLPGYYIAWTLLALLSLGTLPMSYAKLLNGWFVQSRGLALGLALAATGIAGAFIPFLVSGAVAAQGWRGGYLALAGLPLLIALPVLFAWLVEAPSTSPSSAAEGSPTSGVPVRSALRSYRFWALAVAALLLAFGVGGLVPNLYQLLLERGISPQRATGTLAALGISITFGRVLSGFLLDRLWASLVCVALVVPAACALALLAASGMRGEVVLASVVTLGLIAGAEFDLIAYMTVRYFGQKHFSELYGMQYAMFGVGAGSAPAAYGAVHDWLGSYTLLIELSLCLMLLAAGVCLTLGRYPTSFEARATP